MRNTRNSNSDSNNKTQSIGHAGQERSARSPAALGSSGASNYKPLSALNDNKPFVTASSNIVEALKDKSVAEAVGKAIAPYINLQLETQINYVRELEKSILEFYV